MRANKQIKTAKRDNSVKIKRSKLGQELRNINLKKMEKTILYSKKTSIAHSLKLYESCEHQHCKQLVQHIKFLSNSLTQKLLKEHFDHTSVLKSKQNINGKTEINQVSKTIEQEIQTIRKNYTKLRKQLNQVQTENDQLFEENLQLKKKVQKLEQSLTSFQLNKSNFDLSMTKGQEPSPIETKNSFYQHQNSIRNSDNLTNKQNQLPTFELFPQNIDLTLNNFFRQYQKQPDCNIHSTDRTQIFDKYDKLLADFKNTEEELVQSEQKIKDFEKTNKKLHYENQQLKKIIKLRNQIQTSRHQAISGLKSVIDQLML